MGTINCCVDASALVENAHAPSSRVDATLSCLGSIGVTAQAEASGIKGEEKDTEEANTSSSSGSCGHEKQEQTTQAPTAPELSQGSIKTRRRSHRKRKPRQKKLAERQPSLSLFQVTPKTAIRLSDYLCPCDPCPHSQRINRLLNSVFRPQDPHPEDQNPSEIHFAIHRILRGCATFDERKELDEAVVLLVKDLLLSSHGDEDQAFRQLIVHKYQQTPAGRRSSAVTA